MKKFYLYELLNLLGTVEYVGITSNPKIRLYQHIKCKPSKNSSKGKFYQRQDILMNIVEVLDNRKDAWKSEGELKQFYNLPWIEFEVCSKNGKIQGRKNVESGLLKANSEKLRKH